MTHNIFFAITSRIDSTIRFFLYWMIFWLPYSKAMIEVSVIASVFLWLVKRALVFLKLRALHRSRNENSRKIFLDLKHALTPIGNPLNPAIGFFVSICFISVLVSPLFVQSLDGFINKTLEWFAIYFLVLEVFTTRKQIYVALGIFVFTAFATGLDALFQFYVSHQDIFNQEKLTEGYRVTAGFSHANLFGGFLTLAIPVTLSCLFLKFKKSVKLFLILVVLVLIWSLALTYSRGAWTAILAGILFLIFMLFRRPGKFWLRESLIILAVAGTLVAAAHAFEFKKQNESATIQWRIHLWDASLQLIGERPFFGHGLNTYMPLMEDFLIATQSPLGRGFSASYAHNCYLQIAVETGIFGLAAFLGMMILLFRKILRLQPTDQRIRVLQLGMLAGLLAFLLHSALDMNFYSLQLPALFWVMTGLLLSLNKLRNSKKYAIK